MSGRQESHGKACRVACPLPLHITAGPSSEKYRYIFPEKLHKICRNMLQSQMNSITKIPRTLHCSICAQKLFLSSSCTMAMFCAPIHDLIPQISYDMAWWKKHHLFQYITCTLGTLVLLTSPCDKALMKPLNHPVGTVKASTGQDFICTDSVGASSEDTIGLAHPQHQAEYGDGGRLYAQTQQTVQTISTMTTWGEWENPALA